MKITKSIFFKALLLFVMASPATFAKTLNFAIVSDVHYQNTSGVEQTESAKALDGVISRINESKYDFVVFLGDNIEKSKKQELESFLKKVQNIKSPYYLVMGDKDVHKISGLDKRDYIKIVAQYNKNQKKTGNNYDSPKWKKLFICGVLCRKKLIYRNNVIIMFLWKKFLL